MDTRVSQMMHQDEAGKVQAPEEYIVAEGPDGLSKVLESFLNRAQEDEGFAMNGHYILYRLGDQKSLIKVDMSNKPYKFYYYDLLGRPITKAVKNTIVHFLWEKCGLKEEYGGELGE